MTVIDSSRKAMLVRLTKSFPSSDLDSTEYARALYDSTRMWWKISANRTESGPGAPDYAFAVHGGIVHAVYSIESWHRHPQNDRFGFIGTVDVTLEEQYRGTDVSGYFPRGAVNPIKFVNCSATAPTAITANELRSTTASDIDRRSEIEAMADELDAQPLAHIMFGGRELFHSNLLAWFGRHMSSAASVVFDGMFVEPDDPPRPTGHVRRVDRERNHLDVCVWWDDHRRPMVIENKVFSLPDQLQLERYSERVLNDDELTGPRLVLLSLMDPQWPEDTYDTAHAVINGRAWHRVSYGTLGTLIEQAVQPLPPSFEVTLMTNYASMVRTLQNLADAVGVRSLDEQVDLLNHQVTDRLSSNLLSSLSKMRARAIAQRIQSELLRNGYEATVDSGFSNASAVITAFHALSPDQANGTTVGWQLQGSSFRLYAILPALAGKEMADIEARVRWARNNLEFFDFELVDDHLGTAGAPERPKSSGSDIDFNRFNPDFVYRSKPVDSLSVRQLAAAAKAVAALAHRGSGAT